MTALWSAAELAAASGGHMAHPFDASGVSIDTRTLRPGELFVALHGDHGDGHDHVAAARTRGAAGALVDRAVPGPSLQVGDTLAGLRALAAHARARFAGPVLAVTGSVGKTTTKEMLKLCLSPADPARPPAHAAEASHNNHWGVPLTLARLPADAAACVVEIGMNHAGEIAPLSRLAAPTIAIVTTVGASHVGHLGSIAAIADEKASIGAGLVAGGIAILPADSPQLDRLRAGLAGRRILTFGTAPEADARLTDIAPHATHSDLQATIAGRPVALRLHAPGRHMASNALAALLACHAAGHDVAAAAAALAGFNAVAGRGAARRIAIPGGSALLLDESYNAAAASIRAALAVLAMHTPHGAGRRVAVLGDMLELGDHAEAEHRGLAPDVLASADIAFTCGPAMGLLATDLAAQMPTTHATDAARLATIVAAAVCPGDVVLVKGSFGSRMRLVVQALDQLQHEAAA